MAKTNVKTPRFRRNVNEPLAGEVISEIRYGEI